MINTTFLERFFNHFASPFFSQFFVRLRYPVSTPEEIQEAIGVPLSNSLTFQEFMDCLMSSKCCATKLVKYMPREEAEKAFTTAKKKERFRQNSLFSYYFSEGWIEFSLDFDEQSRLRRIYLYHSHLKENFELNIKK